MNKPKSRSLDDVIDDLEEDPETALLLANARRSLAISLAKEGLENYQVGTPNYERLIQGKGPK